MNPMNGTIIDDMEAIFGSPEKAKPSSKNLTINIPVKTMAGWKIEKLICKPAFEFYNEKFVYHKKESGWYQLTHFKTGLTLGVVGQATKLKDAILKSKAYMENIGREEFLDVINNYKAIN